MCAVLWYLYIAAKCCCTCCCIKSTGAAPARRAHQCAPLTLSPTVTVAVIDNTRPDRHLEGVGCVVIEGSTVLVTFVDCMPLMRMLLQLRCAHTAEPCPVVAVTTDAAVKHVHEACPALPATAGSIPLHIVSRPDAPMPPASVLFSLLATPLIASRTPQTNLCRCCFPCAIPPAPADLLQLVFLSLDLMRHHTKSPFCLCGALPACYTTGTLGPASAAAESCIPDHQAPAHLPLHVLELMAEPLFLLLQLLQCP